MAENDFQKDLFCNLPRDYGEADQLAVPSGSFLPFSEMCVTFTFFSLTGNLPNHHNIFRIAEGGLATASCSSPSTMRCSQSEHMGLCMPHWPKWCLTPSSFAKGNATSPHVLTSLGELEVWCHRWAAKATPNGQLVWKWVQRTQVRESTQEKRGYNFCKGNMAVCCLGFILSSGSIVSHTCFWGR